MRVALAVVLTLIPACRTETQACATNLVAAIQVRVSSPHGLAIDAVTATNHQTRKCDRVEPPDEDDGGGADSSAAVHYTCWEDGGGTYGVSVESGKLTWTQNVHVNADACHVTEMKMLTFVLDPHSADSKPPPWCARQMPVAGCP
jgi:hypothetical protein